MKRMLRHVVAALAMLGVCSTAGAGTDKTLVSWVALENTTQQGGSALTIECGDQFDGIVFGERAAGKWMAGSNFFKRTQQDPQANAAEKADRKTLIQMAIVYSGDRIALYRDGVPYASYAAENIDLLSPANNAAVFGLRHHGAETGRTLVGSIEDARIYDRALSAEEIKKLQPNQASEIRPYAWWTFEKGKETDLMGRFPVNVLSGGARIEDGRLVLGSEGATLTAASKGATINVASAGNAAGARMPEVEIYRAFRKKLLADPTRPTYHLVNPEGTAMPGDPNGAIYWKGRYHLHYIVNDGGFSYAHVSSVDMVHWRWHPLTLTPQFTGHGMFSGTCFLNKDGIPTMIYHGAGSGKNQLALASDDNLDDWSKPYPIEPKIGPGQDGSKISHWDPDGWVEGETTYAIFGGLPGSGKPPTLMKSQDLKNWDYLGLFLSKDMPEVQKDEDISCPNFFAIGNKRMLLCISHNRGCRYYLGEWKNEQFTPEFHARMNWNAQDFFAPESLLTPDGRRVMWAWCIGGGSNLWNGTQSLPRELSLPEDGILRIKPLRELERLRYNEAREADIAVEAGKPYRLKAISGDAIELMATIKQGEARRYGVKVLADKDNGRGVDIVVEPASKTIKLGTTAAPFELKSGEEIQLRIFVDRRIVEVFVNDRQAVFKQQDYRAGDGGVCLFAEGGAMQVKEIKGWQMQATNPW